MKDKQNSALNSLNSEFDSDLQAWYELQDKEQPGSDLDAAILKMAKDMSKEVNNAEQTHSVDNADTVADNAANNVVRVENSFWRKNRLALSSAASVMLVVTVVMLNPQSPQDILSDEAMPMMMQMSEPSDTAGESSLGTKMTRGQEAQEPAVQSLQHLDMEPRASVAASDSFQAIDSNKLKGEVPPETMSHAFSGMPQREAAVSAKQALNHLEKLISTKQWDEARALANKVSKLYPQLKSPSDPEYQRWTDIQSELVDKSLR